MRAGRVLSAGGGQDLRAGQQGGVAAAIGDGQPEGRIVAQEVGIVVVAPALTQQDQLGAQQLAPGVGDQIIFTAEVDQVVTQPSIDSELMHGFAQQQGTGIGRDALGADLEVN